MSSISVKYSRQSQSAKSGLMLSFPTPLSSEHASSLEFDLRDQAVDVYEGGGRGKKRKRKGKGKGKDKEASCCSYRGSLEKGAKSGLTKSFAGVYDKRTKVLTLYPTDEGSVVGLEQVNDSYKQVVQDDALVTATYNERVEALTKDFCSAKKIKVVKSARDNLVSAEDTLGSVKGLDKKVLDAAGDDGGGGEMQYTSSTDAIADSYEKVRKGMLPKFDPKATVPSSIYDVEGIAGQGLWRELEGLCERVIKGDSEGQIVWHESITKDVNHILGILSGSGNSASSSKRSCRTRLKALAILNSLITFHNKVGARHKTLKDPSHVLASRFDMRESFVIRFLNLFGQVTSDNDKMGWFFTKTLVDKRLVHVLLLYLIGAGGEECEVATVRDLLQCLGLERRKAADLYRMAGCEVKQKKNGDMAVKLPAPITFPRANLGGRGKKR